MQPPQLSIVNIVAPLIAAAVFVTLMSLVREPARRTLNAILVAGAAGVYLSGGGFGVWELLLPIVMTPLAYKGLSSHWYIGLAWLLHTAADVVHHMWGNPIWPFAPSSSSGCAIFDAAIAVWFLAGAPSLIRSRLPASTIQAGAAWLSSRPPG